MKNDFVFNKAEFEDMVMRVKAQIASQRESLFKSLFSCIDNTTLNGSDTKQSVRDFCRATMSMQPDGVHTASVCVYPVFVAEAKRSLQGSCIGVASVAGGFPSGQIPTKLKADEVRYVVDQGADEVDFVINRGLFLDGETNKVFDEISLAKEICGKSIPLKVILETGELSTPERIYAAAMLSMQAGADFVKTSTGKISVGATPESGYAILSAIADFSKITRRRIAYKAAGGIATVDDALFHYVLTKNMLDLENVDKHIFRIGTSRLTNQLFKILT
jgi:deoxyribose-phosphate aldolase